MKTQIRKIIKMMKMMKMKTNTNITNLKNIVLNMEIDLIDMEIKIMKKNMMISSLRSQRKMWGKNIISKKAEIIKNSKSQSGKMMMMKIK